MAADPRYSAPCKTDFRFPCPLCGYTYITMPYSEGYYYRAWYRSKPPVSGVWSCKKCYGSFLMPYCVVGDYEFSVYSEFEEYEVLKLYRYGHDPEGRQLRPLTNEYLF